MSGTTARLGVLTVIEAITPTVEPGNRFSRVTQDIPILEMVGQIRVIGLGPSSSRDFGYTGPVPRLWADDVTLWVRYELGPVDLEIMQQMIGADERLIVRTIRTGSNWTPYMTHLRVNYPLTRVEKSGPNGTVQAIARGFPLTMHYTET